MGLFPVLDWVALGVIRGHCFIQALEGLRMGLHYPPLFSGTVGFTGGWRDGETAGDWWRGGGDAGQTDGSRTSSMLTSAITVPKHTLNLRRSRWGQFCVLMMCDSCAGIKC